MSLGPGYWLATGCFIAVYLILAVNKWRRKRRRRLPPRRAPDDYDTAAERRRPYDRPDPWTERIGYRKRWLNAWRRLRRKFQTRLT
jgi:hypothetical protein